MSRSNWTRDQLILAMEFYHHCPKRMHTDSHVKCQTVAAELGRTCGGLADNPLQSRYVDHRDEILHDKYVEVCNHCGCDVSRGSGRFVNRVQDFNDVQTRNENNRISPIGDFVCAICDDNPN